MASASTTVLALIGALTAVLGALATWIRAKARRLSPTVRVHDDNAAVFRAALDATDALKELTAAWRGDYGCVMLAHNGGKPLAPHKSLYTSVLYEDLRAGRFDSVKERWQRMPLDEHYTKLLAELWANGQVSITAIEGSNAQLHRAFATYGVQRVLFFRLLETREARYYAAVSWDDPNPPHYHPADRLEQERAAVRLRDTLSIIKPQPEPDPQQ